MDLPVCTLAIGRMTNHTGLVNFSIIITITSKLYIVGISAMDAEMAKPWNSTLVAPTSKENTQMDIYMVISNINIVLGTLMKEKCCMDIEKVKELLITARVINILGNGKKI